MGGQGGSSRRLLSPMSLGLRWRHWVPGRRPRCSPLPAFGGLAALKTPRSAWPAPGRGNRSRVPAWPLPGASPAPPQRPCQRGGREFTPARRNQGASPASISREVGLAGQPRPRTASGASSLATDLLWVSLPQVVTFLLLARVGGRGTTCSFGPGPGACHL